MHRGTSAESADNDSLICRLQDPGAFPHPADDVERLETHISWVLLAGDYAYKIKKPLDLGFLDFSTLEKRRTYCDEELRLNEPWAPSIYLDVVPITEDDNKVRINGTGTVVEYAVRMRRFDQSMRLDAQLALGNLDDEDMLEIGEMLARRHEGASIVPASRRDRAVQAAIDLINENFEPLADRIDPDLLQILRTWTDAELESHHNHFLARFDGGFFRECHGDLHLGNLVRLPDGIATFDCIEFNEDLRQIDITADVAFLVMDLVASDQVRLADLFLNRYLEFGGDYDGMRLFNLYFVYRCLVRAKVAVIRSNERNAEGDATGDIDEAIGYCRMAAAQSTPRSPTLVVMTGLSGSGKTWVSGELMAALPAIRVRSDIERKRLAGLAETDNSRSGIGAGIYSSQLSGQVYTRLFDIAEELLNAGHNVILDATFLCAAERHTARALARQAGCAFVLVQVVADDKALRARLSERHRRHHDASEAGAEVLDYQLRHAEPLTDSELKQAVSCRSDDFDTSSLVAQIRDSSPNS